MGRSDPEYFQLVTPLHPHEGRRSATVNCAEAVTAAAAATAEATEMAAMVVSPLAAAPPMMDATPAAATLRVPMTM